MIGKTISHYKITEKLGAGGMGEVYLANDLKLERQVALKFLPHHLTQNKENIERFEREAKATAALNHPNIITIYDVIEKEGHTTPDKQICIVMEYVEGDSLRTRMDQGDWDHEQVTDITLQICQGLEKAHQANIVHRDIKPENILINTDGRVKILDFGLAKLKGASKLTKETSTLGTIHYMSPEQIQGQDVDRRSDIWSLGIVLYEMLTGKLPFTGEYDQAIVFSIVNENPEPVTALRKGVPVELDRIINKTLSKNPAERYQHISDLLVDLRSLSGGPETGITKSRQGIGKFTKKKSMIFGSIGIFFILIIMVGYNFFLSPEKTIDSIAVLPFSNTANDPELEYLSDGMTETIISNLSKLPGLDKVIARSSVFRYKGKEIVPEEIGNELGVKALLISQISQHADELSIRVELVNTETNSRLWGDQYKRSVTEIFKIQDEISKAIIDNLRLKLTGDEYQRVAKRYTENTEAYQLYLKGRFFANKFTEESLNKSIEFYQQAIDQDPEYALAYVALSITYSNLGWFNYIPPKTAYEKGIAAAVKALEIDNTLGGAYAAIASLKTWYSRELDLKGAEKAYEKALALNPLDANIYHDFAHFLAFMGKHEKSIRLMKKALELEPISIVTISCLGQSYYQAELYDLAIDQLKKAVDMDSNYFHPYGWLGMAYLKKEWYDQAVEMFEKGTESTSYKTRAIGALGYTYAVRGMRNEAFKQLNRLNNLSGQIAVDPCYIAWIYTGLGQKDKAFEWLEKAYEEGSNWLIMINTDGLFDPLRSDVRFTSLVKKIGLVPDLN